MVRLFYPPWSEIAKLTETDEHLVDFKPSKDHWLINYIDTKAKHRHLKILICKGTLRHILSEFIDWRYIIHVGIFDSGLTLLPLPPFPVQYCIYRVCDWEGVGGCWVLLETIFCRSLTLCNWPDSEPTELLDHPKQIRRRGGVPRQINTCRKVPLQVNFFLLTTFCFGVYIVN